MGLRMALGDAALTLTTAAAGTYTSGAIANAGAAADVLVMTHVSAVGAGAPTLVCSLEESDTGNSGWTAVAGSAHAAVAGVGNAVSNARAGKNYVRVSAVVAGTTPTVTGRVSVLMFAD
jgi:hypothetical protein